MLLSTLLAAWLLPATAPTQATPADTTSTVPGLFNRPFAWGTLVLRDGRRLQGYLPTTGASPLEGLPYYDRHPHGKPRGKFHLWPLTEVRAMLVKGQHYVVLPGPGGPQLAARRQTGAAELYLAQAAAPVTSFLGSAPVMGLPTSTPGSVQPRLYYLRHPSGGEPLALTAENFATQLPTFLADDKELAAKVAAKAPGYGFDDTESIIAQYNQRATGR